MKYSKLLTEANRFFKKHGTGNEISDLFEESPEIIIERKIKKEFTKFFEEKIEHLDLLTEFLTKIN